jgi:hypothetical protein
MALTKRVDRMKQGAGNYRSLWTSWTLSRSGPETVFERLVGKVPTSQESYL